LLLLNIIYNIVILIIFIPMSFFSSIFNKKEKNDRINDIIFESIPEIPNKKK